MKRLIHISLLLILLGAIISIFTRQEVILPAGEELFVNFKGEVVHITSAWHSTVPPVAPAETPVKYTYDPIGHPIVFAGYLLFLISGLLYIIRSKFSGCTWSVIGILFIAFAIFFGFYFNRPGTSLLLHSTWMPIHVASCAVGYILLIGATLKPSNLLTLGLYFLGLGIITGSVWAVGAWGTYWDWDPKETCALITWLIYAAALHTRRYRQPLLDLGLLCILLTYLIPQITGSVHSY